MNNLLIFFALPVATVILSIVLQKVLKNTILVSATFLAIYLVVTFAFADSDFLLFAILYTILAYIAAVLTRLICRLIRMLENRNNNGNCRIIERPITINNTSPINSESLASDTTLLPNVTNTDANTDLGRTNENSNCNSGNRCGRR